MKKSIITSAINGQAGFIGSAYLFNGKEYVKYDWSKDKPVAGYPKALSLWHLPGNFGEGVDAAINGAKGFSGNAYFFKGDQYCKYDWTKDAPVTGYPKPITLWNLPGNFDRDIDAACLGGGSAVGFGYFFKGGEYVKYDWTKDQPVPGYPKPISAWKLPASFLGGIDAAVNGGGQFKDYVYFFKGDQYVRYEWATSTTSAAKSIRDLWGFQNIWNDGNSGDSSGKKLLIVFIENTGQLPLPSGTPKWIEDNLESLADTVLEGAEKALNNFEDAQGPLYDKVILLEDATATFPKFRDTILDYSKKGYAIDIIIQAHGNATGFSGYKHVSISDSDIESLKATYGKALPIRAVYQMNCTGSGLNDEWRKIGAQVVSGSDKLNYFPEPLMSLFWRKWKGGASFENAVNGAYSDLDSVLWIGKSISAVDDAFKQSKPIISGNGKLSI